MNRIHQAGVILTLTEKEAILLLSCYRFALRTTVEQHYRDLLRVLEEQYRAQGVRS